MKAPDFWRPGSGGAAATVLAPLGWLYGMGTALRLQVGRPHRFDVPILCVGNLIAGGSGKTPVVIDFAERLRGRGLNVHIVTRGYGGTVSGFHPVGDDDCAAAVGDEALLLARVAPTWVADDRRAGCRVAVREGAEAIIFDDGFQDPCVWKTLSVVVVDGGFGFGNGRMIPAGPLRERISAGLSRADAVVVVGTDDCNVAAHFPPGLTVMTAMPEPDPRVRERTSQPALAFAGIGRPEKFFQSLRDTGVTLAGVHRFADHHRYTADELGHLKAEAQALGAFLITTAKDFVRIDRAHRCGITVAAMTLAWDSRGEPDRLLDRIFAEAEDVRTAG